MFWLQSKQERRSCSRCQGAAEPCSDCADARPISKPRPRSGLAGLPPKDKGTWASLRRLWELAKPLVSGGVEVVKRDPLQVGFLFVVILRLFGARVESGWRGVLFRSGRASRVLEPGFHWLVPWFWRVRTIRSRSVTIDLPGQSVLSVDGIVYEVDSTLVFRVVDPLRALVAVDRLRPACAVVTAVAVQELVRGRSRTQLQSCSEDLDRDLARILEPRLESWGVLVERAGFTRFAPCERSTRLTQLEVRAAERERVYRGFVAAGLHGVAGLAMLGAEAPMGRAALRARRAGTRHALGRHFAGARQARI